jgi:hypothetical protein
MPLNHAQSLVVNWEACSATETLSTLCCSIVYIIHYYHRPTDYRPVVLTITIPSGSQVYLAFSALLTLRLDV